MINRETKATFIILFAVALFIGIIVISLLIINNNKKDDVYFPNYENKKINENDINDYNSESYLELKRQLQNDYYFAKEALISNYNSLSFSSTNLQDMIWNFIFSYDINNNLNHIISINRDDGVFCMRKRNVIDAFKELYGIDITNEIELFEGYFQYVTVSLNTYCFNYGNVSMEYNNNEIYTLIDKIIYEDGILTTNLYLYEFYTMDSPSEIENVKLLKRAIDNNNYNEANNIVNNYLVGKVTHKQLDFKVQNNAEHFKYQILSSKLLDY